MGESVNMSVSENIQHILERLGKLDTLETLLTKTLANLENLETRVNVLDLRVETLEAKCRGHDKSIGEVKGGFGRIRDSHPNSRRSRGFA